MNYDILSALPAAAYTYPELFVTGYDVPGDEHSEFQYQKGLQIAQEYARIVIDRRSVWHAYEGGSGLVGQARVIHSSTHSYEGIGYHRSTAELLRGFLDGTAAVWVEREDDTRKITRTCIKDAANPDPTNARMELWEVVTESDELIRVWTDTNYGWGPVNVWDSWGCLVPVKYRQRVQPLPA